MPGRIPPNRPHHPKKPIQMTPEENAALDKKIAKAGTSGVSNGKTPPTSPKTLSRSNSDLQSTSSFGSAHTAGSQPSTTPSSPMAEWVGDQGSPKSGSSESGSHASSPSLSPRTQGLVDRFRAIRDDAIETFGASHESPTQNGNTVLKSINPGRSLSDITPQPSAPMNGPTSAGAHSAPTSPRGGFQMESASPGTPGSSEPTSPGWPAYRPGPMNFDRTVPFTPDASQPNTPHGSEPSSQGSPRLTRSNSEPPSPMNWGKIHDQTALKNAEHGKSFSISSGFSGDRFSFNEDPLLHGNKGGHWVPQTETPHVHIGRYKEDPLLWKDLPNGREASRLVPPPTVNRGPDRHAGTGLLSDPVAMPELHSGPNTPTTRPGPMPGQGSTHGIETTLPTPPQSPNAHAAPQEPQSPNGTIIPPAPDKKSALGALGPKSQLALGALAIAVPAAVIVPAVFASKSDDSSNGEGTPQT